MAEYDIPQVVFTGEHSQAFRLFFHNWFEDSRGLARGEVDTAFLQELAVEERKFAIELLRRNLHLGCTHIIEGIAALEDLDSIPALEEMLKGTSDDSKNLRLPVRFGN